MNTTIIKLQVPMNKTLRDDLAARATELGFDSAQALLRYMAKAVADRRQVTFGADDWGEPSPAAAVRLNKWAKEARQGKNVSRTYVSVEDFMKDL
jgi:predicted DsbA family dithiol-disulfide isomerase